MTQSDADSYDPNQAAMQAEMPSGPRILFGEVQVDLWPCVLAKGQGKIPFDATQHSVDQRRTAVDITLIPTRGNYSIERRMIAESNEWIKIVKPSLRELKIDLRALNGRFVRAELASTGRVYTNSAGEAKEMTTFKFVKLYDDMVACLTDADAFFAGKHKTEPTATTAKSTETPPSAPASEVPETGNQREREMAAKFLPAIVKLAEGDLTRLQTLLATYPLVSKYYTISSPEIVSLLTAAS